MIGPPPSFFLSAPCCCGKIAAFTAAREARQNPQQTSPRRCLATPLVGETDAVSCTPAQPGESDELGGREPLECLVSSPFLLCSALPLGDTLILSNESNLYGGSWARNALNRFRVFSPRFFFASHDRPTKVSPPSPSFCSLAPLIHLSKYLDRPR